MERESFMKLNLFVQKRDGTIAEFGIGHIKNTLEKAVYNTWEFNEITLNKLVWEIVDIIDKEYNTPVVEVDFDKKEVVKNDPKILTSEDIETIIVNVLATHKFNKTAHNYKEYSNRRICSIYKHIKKYVIKEQ